MKNTIYILGIIMAVHAQTLKQKVDQKTGQDIPVGIALGSRDQGD